MKPHVIILLAIVLITSDAAAQIACGTDSLHKISLSRQPDYAQAFKTMSQEWANSRSASNKIISTANGLIYEIPAVVHIVHSGEQIGSFYNPSDIQIQDMIAFLNECFAAQSNLMADTLSGGVHVPFRFVLAARDPSCNATNGIVRVDGSVYPNYPADGVRYLGNNNGVVDSAIKLLSVWPRDSYYNIWLVNKIDNGAWSGYATFPAAAPGYDGTMMGVFVAQQPFTSLTFPHEIGHAFGLLHTFWGSNGSNCPANSNCLTDGDDICDTEPHTLNSGCPSGINTCTGQNYNDVQYNVMNYTNCTDRFTAGQRDKMVFTLLNFRQSLLTSYGGMAPGINPPVLPQPPNACTPTTIINPSFNFNVGLQNVKLNDLFVHTSGYDGDGKLFYVDHTGASCLQPQAVAHLHRDSTYILTVTTGANPEYLRGWIDFDNNGSFSASELVISKNGSLSFETHTTSIVLPANAVSCTPLRFRLASDMIGTTPQPCSNPQYGQVEDFIVVITTNNASVSISASPAINVTLNTIVSFSANAVNGGNAPSYQWFKNGQSILNATASVWTATAGISFNTGDAIFVKLNSNAPCTQPLPISSNVLLPTIISSTVTGLDTQQKNDSGIKLYPNPNSGEFIITTSGFKNGTYRMHVSDVLRRSIYESDFTILQEKPVITIQLPVNTEGVYYIKFYSGTELVDAVKMVVAP